MIKKILCLSASFVFVTLPSFVFAQAADGVDAEKKYTAFEMRNNGKIYVLTACILVIMIGLIAYLVRLDRKIGRLEKETK